MRAQFGYEHLLSAQATQRLGDYKGTTEALWRAVESNPSEVTPFLHLGYLALGMRDYDRAIAAGTRALAVAPDHPLSSSMRGRAKMGKKDFRGAVTDFDEAIRLNPKYAHAYSYRGQAKAELGELPAALADCEQSVVLRPDALAFRNRSTVRKLMGDEAGAKADAALAANNDSDDIVDPTQVRAVPRWEIALHRYQIDGKTAKALTLLQNLRAHFQTAGRPETDDASDVLWRLGVLFRDLGNFGEARRSFQQATQITDRLHGTTSRQRLNYLNHESWLLIKEKKFREAETHAEEVVHQIEAAFGSNDRLLLDALPNLTTARLELGNFEGCEAAIQRILQLEATTRPQGVREFYPSAGARINIGTYYLQMGQTKPARVALETGAARVILNGGSIIDRHLIARNFARLALDLNNRDQALFTAGQVLQLERRLMREVFPTLDEGGRLDLMRSLEPLRWFATIGDPEGIAAAVLQMKAVTIDQFLAAPGASVEDDPFADLLDPKNIAGAFELHTEAVKQPSPSPRTAAVKTTNPDAQTSLTSVTALQVCRALPARTVAVEFVRYPHYLGRYQDELRYGALVFHAQSGTPTAPKLSWVPLGPAEVIDRDIAALDTSMHDPLSAGLVAGRLRALHTTIWEPIAKDLAPDTENIFISSDGQTCFLPFGALLDSSNRFLADKYLIMHLSTVRDLFTLQREESRPIGEIVVFAAPTYGHPEASAASGENRFRDIDLRAMATLHLADLPGARREAELIKQLADKRQLKTAVFLGDEANKRNVQAIRSPRMVHFATHGFFLAAAGDQPAGNPMQRSGLALTGAHTTLKALANGGPAPSSLDDGLLTAMEVAKLQLAGTWIATLSACDSGRGDAHDGEGVLGLRRGFLAAGVQNLVIALWKIPDLETAGFMQDFYTRALDSSDAATAFALAQRDSLNRIRREQGIAAAVRTAGAFVLNTSRRISLQAEPAARK